MTYKDFVRASQVGFSLSILFSATKAVVFPRMPSFLIATLPGGF
jgi:hypothetical protein